MYRVTRLSLGQSLESVATQHSVWHRYSPCPYQLRYLEMKHPGAFRAWRKTDLERPRSVLAEQSSIITYAKGVTLASKNGEGGTCVATSGIEREGVVKRIRERAFCRPLQYRLAR